MPESCVLSPESAAGQWSVKSLSSTCRLLAPAIPTCLPAWPLCHEPRPASTTLMVLANARRSRPSEMCRA
jgi:hypothetical protein